MPEEMRAHRDGEPLAAILEDKRNAAQLAVASNAAKLALFHELAEVIERMERIFRPHSKSSRKQEQILPSQHSFLSIRW